MIKLGPLDPHWNWIRKTPGMGMDEPDRTHLHRTPASHPDLPHHRSPGSQFG
jgi:hypothetical protein